MINPKTVCHNSDYVLEAVGPLFCCNFTSYPLELQFQPIFFTLFVIIKIILTKNVLQERLELSTFALLSLYCL